MQGWTSAGYIFIGLIAGTVVGFIWGTIRERKGKNKDIAELEDKVKDLTDKLKNKH